MPSVATTTDDGGLWGQLLASVLAKSQLSSAKTVVMLGNLIDENKEITRSIMNLILHSILHQAIGIVEDRHSLVAFVVKTFQMLQKMQQLED
jgi:hypothetical protein